MSEEIKPTFREVACYYEVVKWDRDGLQFAISKILESYTALLLQEGEDELAQGIIQATEDNDIGSVVCELSSFLKCSSPNASLLVLGPDQVIDDLELKEGRFVFREREPQLRFEIHNPNPYYRMKLYKVTNRVAEVVSGRFGLNTEGAPTQLIFPKSYFADQWYFTSRAALVN